MKKFKRVCAVFVSLLLVVILSFTVVACSDQQILNTGKDEDIENANPPTQTDEGHESTDEDDSPATVLGEGITTSSYESLNGVESEYKIAIKSTDDLTLENLSYHIEVFNQLEEEIALQVEKENEVYYVYQVDGFIPGYTYSVALLSSSVQFADVRFAEKRGMSFSVKRDDAAVVAEKKSIKVLNDFPLISYRPGENIKVTLAYDYGLKVDDIIKVNVLYYGFKVPRVFVVVILEYSENGVVLELREATIEEIYDELDISGSLPISEDNIYVRYQNEPIQEYIPTDAVQIILQEDEQIADQIKNSEFVQDAIGRLSTKEDGSVKIKTVFTIGKTTINNMDYVTVDCETHATVPLVSKNKSYKLNFEINVDISVKIGAEADLNITSSAFGFNVHVITETTYNFALTYKKSIEKIGKINIENGGLEDLKNYVRQVNDFGDYLPPSSKKSLQFKLFDIYVPFAGSLLGLVTEIRVAIDISLQAELSFEIINSTEREIGLHKAQGLEFYNNVIKDETSMGAAIEGRFGVKAGPVFGLYVSAAGISVGIEVGAGVYIEAAGVFSMQVNNNMQTEEAFAAYIEMGLYVDISVVAEVQFIIWQARLDLYRFPNKEYPLLVLGNQKMITLQPQEEGVLLDNQNQTTVPQIEILVTDLLTFEQSVYTISAARFREEFEILNHSGNIDIDNNGFFVLKDGHEEEFTEDVQIKLKDYQKYIDVKSETDLPISTKYILINPEKYLINSFVVTRQLIPIEKITLSYEQVTEDAEYPNVSGIEAEYIVRDSEDFQIGRLVRVVPDIIPLSATYRTLDYNIVSGAEYIQNFSTYEENGITYAVFRVKENVAAIGNSIQISATSNGYKGDYADLNVTGSSLKPITITEIPATDFKMGVFDNGEWSPIGPTDALSIKKGEVIIFDFLPQSVKPANATMSMPVGHFIDDFDQIFVKSGNAEIIELGEYRAIRTLDSAKVGEQITVVGQIGQLQQEFYFVISKIAVESVVLLGGSEEINAGSERIIEIQLTTSGTPTYPKATFYVLDGETICSIEEFDDDFSKVVLSVDQSAKANSIIRVVAVVDGIISNVITYQVLPIEPTQLTLSSDSGTESVQIVQKGQVIQHSVVVSPGNASSEVFYKIVPEESTLQDGKYMGEVDSNTGELKINYSGDYPDTLTIAAYSGNIKSNYITYIFEKTNVTSIEFVPNVLNIYVRPGDVVKLQAKVNADASIKTINYLFRYGEEYGTLDNDTLTIHANFSGGRAQIGITAVPVDNPDLFADININIVKEDFQVLLNGMMEEVYVTSTDILLLSAVNKNGNDIPLNEIVFYLYDEDWVETEDIYVLNGQIIFADDVSFTEAELNYVIECIYDNNFSYIFLNITWAPNSVYVRLKDSEFVCAGNEVSFDLIANPSYGNFTNDLHVEILSGEASVVDKDTIYIAPNAQVGSEIVIVGKWIDEKGHAVISNPLSITVKTGITSVEITNMKEIMMLGEIYRLEAVYTPSYMSSDGIKFHFSSSEYLNYATLDEETGLLAIGSDRYNHLKVIKVFCSVNGIRSIDYEITLVNFADNILYTVSSTNELSSYNEDLQIYLLERHGSLQFDATVLDENGFAIVLEDVQWHLVENGTNYLNLSEEGIVTVKENAPDISFEATLFASCKSIAGEPIKIIIAQGISTSEEFKSIKNNYYGYYILESDIDFDYVNKEQSLFTGFPVFYGILEGNGYQVRNVTFDIYSDALDYGLILENRGIIQNLVISTMISFYDNPGKSVCYVGGIAARNFGVIRNCRVNSSSYFFVNNEGSYVGGVAGLNCGLISECSNYVTIIGNEYAGGIAGCNKGTIEYSVNARILILENVDEAFEYLGIVGCNEGTITECAHFKEVYEGIKDYNISEYEEDSEAAS